MERQDDSPDRGAELVDLNNGSPKAIAAANAIAAELIACERDMRLGVDRVWRQAEAVLRGLPWLFEWHVKNGSDPAKLAGIGQMAWMLKCIVRRGARGEVALEEGGRPSYLSRDLAVLQVVEALRARHALSPGDARRHVVNALAVAGLPTRTDSWGYWDVVTALRLRDPDLSFDDAQAHADHEFSNAGLPTGRSDKDKSEWGKIVTPACRRAKANLARRPAPSRADREFFENFAELEAAIELARRELTRSHPPPSEAEIDDLIKTFHGNALSSDLSEIQPINP